MDSNRNHAVSPKKEVNCSLAYLFVDYNYSRNNVIDTNISNARIH